MGYALRLCVRLDVAVRCVQGGGGHPLLAWFSGQAVVDTPYTRAPSVLGYALLLCVRLRAAFHREQCGGGRPLLSWFSGQAAVDTP